MENNQQRVANREVVVKAANGWPMVGLLLLLGAAAIAGIPYGAVQNQPVVMIGRQSVLVAAYCSCLTRLVQSAAERGTRISLIWQLQRHGAGERIALGNPFYSNGGCRIQWNGYTGGNEC